MPVIESTVVSSTLPVSDSTPQPTPQPRKNAKPATEPKPTRILSVSTQTEDHTALERILDGLPVQISAVSSCREALEYLRNQPASVVFCDHRMKDGTWRDILNQVLGAAEPAPVVVTSRLADEYLWAEVLNLGGWDVLAKPFHEQEVLHVLDSAWLHRANPVTRTRVAGAA
jgi:DNA-binding NtrC family response regulator